MLKNAEKSLKDVRAIRRWRRRAGRVWNRVLGRPDAWADLLKICRHVQPAAILDVGSHIGRTVARFADEITTIPIHAFEPTPNSAATLRRKTACFVNVNVHEIALADRSGVLPFHVNRHGPANSLLDNATGNGSAAASAADLREHTQHIERIEVKAMTLDEWCAANASTGNLVVKADMQGAEGLLLKGGANVFGGRRIAAFYSEVMFTEIYQGQASFFDLHQTLTRDFGMSLWQMYEISRDSTGRAAWGDALWVNDRALNVIGR